MRASAGARAAGAASSPRLLRPMARAVSRACRQPAGTAGTNNDQTNAWLGAINGSTHATFSASVTPGVATQIVVQNGNAQTGRAAVQLPLALGARVGDRHGNGVAGIAVQWQVEAGSGTVAAVDATSTAAGLATARWTLGLHAGASHASATASGIASSPVANFTATATPNGTISGNIAVASQQVAAPVVIRANTKQRAAIIPLTAGPNRAPSSARAIPDELIVIFRASRLKTAPLGSPALAAASNVQLAGQAIRSRLAVREAAGEFRTRGVS